MADKKAPGKRLPEAFDDEMIQDITRMALRMMRNHPFAHTLCAGHMFGESLCHFQGFVVEHMLSTDREFKL